MKKKIRKYRKGKRTTKWRDRNKKGNERSFKETINGEKQKSKLKTFKKEVWMEKR